MSIKRPCRTREFQIWIVFGTQRIANEALGKIGRIARGKTLFVTDEWVRDKTVYMKGKYVVHGNGNADFRRFIINGVKGLGRGNKNQPIRIHNLHIDGSRVRITPCADPSCGGCEKYKKEDHARDAQPAGTR